MSARRCRACDRILVSKNTWDALTLDQRKRLYKTHAPHRAFGLCRKHYVPGWRNVTEDDAYTGGWVRRGLILVPYSKNSTRRGVSESTGKGVDSSSTPCGPHPHGQERADRGSVHQTRDFRALSTQGAPVSAQGLLKSGSHPVGRDEHNGAQEAVRRPGLLVATPAETTTSRKQ